MKGVFKIQNLSDHIDYVLVVISVFYILFLYTKLRRPRYPPLPPGPWGLPIIGNIPFLKPDLHTYFQDLAKTHGPIFKLRLGAKLTIVVTSSELAHEILRTNDVIFANRDVPVVGRINTYGGTDVAWSPYGPRWRMLRKLCTTKVLNNAMLDSSRKLRIRETRRTVRYLVDRARNGSSVNLGEIISSTIQDAVTQMLWGATIKGKEREILGAEFSKIATLMSDLVLEPNISDFFPMLSRFDLQGVVKRMKEPAHKMDQMFDRIINQRLGMVREGDGDFLDALLNIKDENIDFTMTDVKALLMDMVIAGIDTSSHVLEFVMAEVLNRPDIMKRAQQELDKVVGKDKIVEEFHIPKLPYTLAIMKETLRLHTILPLLIPHCPSKTTVVGGFTIPKDATIFINAWAIHRNPNVWENPLDFDPGRFLYKDYSYNGNDLNYLPFGSGRRMCIGMAMGERMVLYNLATLLHSFDWKRPQGVVVVEEKFGAVLQLKNPLVVTPILRLSDPNLYL
ncbi:unnamed protein product [Cochlearia groenlandica]